MSKFGMVGKFTTAPEDRNKLIDILTQAAQGIKDLDTCYLYVVSKDANDDSVVCVMELWESKEAHDESLKLDGARELISQAMPLLKGQPEGTTLIPVSGKGL